MINLIRNELYKIFHRKGIYIVLSITLLWVMLTNFLYSDVLTVTYEVDDNEIEYYESEEDISSSEYLYTKADFLLYEYLERYSYDDYQKYVFDCDNILYSDMIDIYVDILMYENDISDDEEEYNNALSLRNEIYDNLNNMTWKEFAEYRLDKLSKENIDGIYDVEIDTLQLRIEYDIIYGDNDMNDYLIDYEDYRNMITGYENDNNLSSGEQEELENYKGEVSVLEYKIKNNISDAGYASVHSVLSNFYDEYFIMILVMIIIVSGGIVSNEFSKGTIKMLLVKPYSRTKILMSKFITVLIMILFAIVSTLIMQMIVGGIAFGFDSLSIPSVVYNYSSNSVISLNIFKYFLFDTLAILPEFIFIGLISMLISTLSLSTSLSNTLTIIGVFGSSIVEGLALYNNLNFVKYYLTLNWDFRYYLYGGSSPYDITLIFSIIVCLVYFIVMIYIMIMSFKRRDIKNV